MAQQGLKQEEPIVKMVNITKHFGGVYALKNVDFELYHGEVLALVGDNGAGKSTLIKILSGAYTADEGKIYIAGEKVNIESPMDAKKFGIETVYQDLALIDILDIPTNIFIGREVRRTGILGTLGVLNMKAMKEKAMNLMEQFDIKIKNVNTAMKNLSGGQRQIVAISRAVYFNARVIIMDEPTAALGVEETRRVYSFIERLKEAKICIIIISHNINEVFNLADRIMVLKTGNLVGVKRKEETSTEEIINMIISGKCGWSQN